jgi:hypothetical protein
MYTKYCYHYSLLIKNVFFELHCNLKAHGQRHPAFPILHAKCARCVFTLLITWKINAIIWYDLVAQLPFVEGGALDCL